MTLGGRVDGQTYMLRTDQRGWVDSCVNTGACTARRVKARSILAGWLDRMSSLAWPIGNSRSDRK